MTAGDANTTDAADTVTWASLFDRASEYDVDVADVRAAVDARRSGVSGGVDGGDGSGSDGGIGDDADDDGRSTDSTNDV